MEALRQETEITKEQYEDLAQKTFHNLCKISNKLYHILRESSPHSTLDTYFQTWSNLRRELQILDNSLGPKKQFLRSELMLFVGRALVLEDKYKKLERKTNKYINN